MPTNKCLEIIATSDSLKFVLLTQAAQEGKCNLTPTKALSDIEISIPPKSDYVALIRRLTGDLTAINSPLEQSDIDDLVLSISEATTNAVHAHTDKGTDRPVTIKFSFEPSALIVEVRDRGAGFDPQEMDQIPDMEHPERLVYEHGLGVYLYCTHTDEHEIVSTRRGTKVRLVKNYK